MSKSYLRYEPNNNIFGVICSPQCNIELDLSGNLVLTGALQNVIVWNIRQANQVNCLKSNQPNYPYGESGECISLCRSTNGSTIACGYTNGQIRIYNFINGTLLSTLSGHRTSVISLSYDKSGQQLLSGGADSDIILWDTVSYVAICKFRGHKDAVTGVGFIEKESQQLLVSTSKDTLLKVWDITTRHCIQTIVGHRCEIWALGISPDSSMIITGSSDSFIRAYKFKSYDEHSDNANATIGDDEVIIEYFGCITRNMSSGSSKCASIDFNSDGSLFSAQSNGKVVEIFKIRSDNETKKKTKRRLKRIKEKEEKKNNNINNKGNNTEYSSWTEEPLLNEYDDTTNNFDETSNSLSTIFTDKVERFSTIRCDAKVRGFKFSPIMNKDGTYKAVLSLINNELEVYEIPSPQSNNDDDAIEGSKECEKKSIIEFHGNRSDIRGVALSSDGLLVGTCNSDGIKLWSTRSYLCLKSCKAGFVMCIAFVPGDRFLVAGTKEGYVLIMDTASGELVINMSAHDASIWSLAIRPDGKGFMTGSADKVIKFWDFVISKDTSLGIKLIRQLESDSDVLCVKYSPTKNQDKLMIAFGLLDSTVKVFYDDSLKFFLSLYGHKLPVMSLDISYDSTILISGSADKTIKIWGLDFGDCHRSLIGHEESVTCVRFQPETHYFFSSGKDGVIKYWDADRFEQILYLPGHVSCVWSLDVTYDGSFCISGGQDRSLRIWERTEDMVFVEEEKERYLEAQVNKTTEKDIDDHVIDSTGVASIKNLESVKGGELLMEALDLVEAELEDIKECNFRNSSGGNIRRQPNPMLLGLSPHKYMIRCLRMVKAPDLEHALIILPFHYVGKFISMLLDLIQQGLELELCTRCAVFLLRCHQAQIVSTASLVQEMLALKQIIRESVGDYRDLLGTNIAGLKYMNRQIQNKKRLFTDM